MKKLLLICTIVCTGCSSFIEMISTSEVRTYQVIDMCRDQSNYERTYITNTNNYRTFLLQDNFKMIPIQKSPKNYLEGYQLICIEHFTDGNNSSLFNYYFHAYEKNKELFIDILYSCPTNEHSYTMEKCSFNILIPENYYLTKENIQLNILKDIYNEDAKIVYN